MARGQTLDTALDQAVRGYTAAVVPLIRAYFPPTEVLNAACILYQEIKAMAQAGVDLPASQVTTLSGPITCRNGTTASGGKAYGLFQIVDSCWSPYVVGTSKTPFTPSEWDNILDPNVNTWAASVVWSTSGWRAWSTCGACGVCDVMGGPIPYPRNPLTLDQVFSRFGDDCAENPLGGLLLAGVGVGLMGLLAWQHPGRGY